MATTPKQAVKTLAGAVETKLRLERCWKVDINWELYPMVLQEVSAINGKAVIISIYATISITPLWCVVANMVVHVYRAAGRLGKLLVCPQQLFSLAF